LAADQLAQVLETMGFRVLLDRTFISEGENLEDAADRMIEESSKIFLLFFPKCLDHSIVKKMIKGLPEDEEDYFQYELRLAFQSSKRIIPVLLDISVQELKDEVEAIQDMEKFGIHKYTVDMLFTMLKKKVIVLDSADISQLQQLHF
jgi:hypothetical protein